MWFVAFLLMVPPLAENLFIPPSSKILPSRLAPPNFYHPCSATKSSHCSCSIFVLILYSLDTYVMLILILIDVQYSQKAVFSFEKGSNCQNHHSSPCSHHTVKKIPPKKNFQFHPLTSYHYFQSPDSTP